MEENEHNRYIYSEEDQLEAPLYSSSSAYSDGSSSPFIENSPNDSPPFGFLTFLVGNLLSYSVFSAYNPFEGLSFIFTQQETILNNEPYDRLQQDLEEAKRSRQEAENEAIRAIYMVCYKQGFFWVSFWSSYVALLD